MSRKALTQVGALVRVNPVFGYGWYRKGSVEVEERIDTPKEFHFLVREFLQADGVLVGILGQVSQSDHSLNGLQICALPRPEQEIDFDDVKGNYNLLLSPNCIRLTGTHHPPHPQAIESSGFPAYRGYATGIFRSQ